MSKIPDGFAGPSLNLLIEKGEVCQCLREKKMFYQSVGTPLAAPADGEESAAGPEDVALCRVEGPFWCAHTQSLLGPDGQIADVGRCRPGRSCCETA